MFFFLGPDFLYYKTLITKQGENGKRLPVMLMLILHMCSWKWAAPNDYCSLSSAKNEKQSLNANVSQMFKGSITTLSKSYRQRMPKTKLILLYFQFSINRQLSKHRILSFDKLKFHQTELTRTENCLYFWQVILSLPFHKCKPVCQEAQASKEWNMLEYHEGEIVLNMGTLLIRRYTDKPECVNCGSD